MQAILFLHFGTPDVLELTQLPIPKPKDNQVVIKVHAAGLNPIDYKIRNGTSFVAKKLKDSLPSGLGYDLAGEIVAVGEKVTDFKVGDAVLGLAGFRERPCSYAEYACTSSETLIHKPKELSYIEAGALPLAGLTALQSFQKISLKQGQLVLIHAGAGGVGHIAIQLAKLAGIKVVTTASKSSHPFLYSLGVDRCIDYHTENFAEVLSEKVDGVLDLIGGSVGIQSLNVLSPSGCLVTVPTVNAAEVLAAATEKQLQAFDFHSKPDMKQLTDLAGLAAKGKLKINIARTFNLSEATLAHTLLEEGHTQGKLVFQLVT